MTRESYTWRQAGAYLRALGRYLRARFWRGVDAGLQSRRGGTIPVAASQGDLRHLVQAAEAISTTGVTVDQAFLASQLEFYARRGWLYRDEMLELAGEVIRHGTPGLFGWGDPRLEIPTTILGRPVEVRQRPWVQQEGTP